MTADEAVDDATSERRGGGSALGILGFLVALAIGFFAMQAYRGREVREVVVPQGPRVAIPLRGDEPQQGPDDALVTVVEFTDYECAYCARAQAPLEAAMDAIAGDVRRVIKHMPMPRHENAAVAARIAWAAHQQGRFFDVHPRLFDAQGVLAEMGKAAEDLGLDRERLRADLQSPEAAADVDDDLFQGAKAGVKATPTFFVNGHAYEGSRTRAEWVDILAVELAAARALVEDGTPRAEVYRVITTTQEANHG